MARLSQCRISWVSGVLIAMGHGCSSSRSPDPSDTRAPIDETTPSSGAGPSSSIVVMSTSGGVSSNGSASSNVGMDPGAITSPTNVTSEQSSTDALSHLGDEASTVGGATDEHVSAAPSNAPSESSQEMASGTCTVSETVRMQFAGSGPHAVVVETNSDPGINEGTIFRPADLGGGEKYPIFVWGEGGCSQNGLSNANALAEIASHGYFVVADGIPNGSGNRTMDRSNLDAMGAPLIAYVDWAIEENAKPCSIYHQSLDTEKIASNGYSCGGLMAQGTVLDPRIVTWGVTSSGMAGATREFYDAIHTPVLFVEGGPEDIAYEGALQGYETISGLGVPVMWFDKALGHGGDLFSAGGGDFTKINLAWLNWWLKGDVSATGKGLLVGAQCPYCSDPDWDVRYVNIP